jgi:uncharacterized protein YeaO (DUF488 family)
MMRNQPPHSKLPRHEISAITSQQATGNKRSSRVSGIKLKRVYDEPDPDDGFRILVDRLWPRGVSKNRAHIDLWLKDIAPSTELRQWFGHDPAKWRTFTARYARELKENKSVVDELLRHAKAEPVTLVYGAKDEEHNDAVVLKAFLESDGKSA